MDINNKAFKELINEVIHESMNTDKMPKDLKNVIASELEKEKTCQEAYQRIYNANRNICKRLNVQKDMDVECILTNYSLITKTLCLKMYDYGFQYIQDENIQKLIVFYNELPDHKKEKFMEFIHSIDILIKRK